MTAKKKYTAPIGVLGGGFATDAFDLFIMNAVMIMLKPLTKATDADKSAISMTALAAAMVGQVTFGVMGDTVIGRGPIFMLSALLMFVGCLASALIPLNIDPTQNDTTFFIGLSLARVVLGIGIGGEYPLSASVGHSPHGSGSGSAAVETSAKRLTKIFAFQGVGILAAVLVAYICFHVTSESVSWRFSLGFGMIPSLIMMIGRYYYFFYLPSKQSDSLLGEAAPEAVVSQPPTAAAAAEAAPPSAWQESKTNLSIIWRLYRREFCGTTVNWFLLDVVFYANGLFSGTILTAFTGGKIKTTLEYNIYLALVASLGYLLAIGLVDRMGRRKLQIYGFLLMAITYLATGFVADKLDDDLPLFISLYGLTFLWSNAGPNTTTYLLASEVFPDSVRSTASGLSAATGKLGAALGVLAMAPLASASLEGVFFACSGISILGLCVTLYCSDDMRELDVEAIYREKQAR
jgi:PHS family inorganic phosphate transporter-like MFS transporter